MDHRKQQQPIFHTAQNACQSPTTSTTDSKPLHAQSPSLSMISNTGQAIVTESEVNMAGNSVNQITVSVVVGAQSPSSSKPWLSRMKRILGKQPSASVPGPTQSSKSSSTSGSPSEEQVPINDSPSQSLATNDSNGELELLSLDRLDINALLEMSAAPVRMPHEIYVRQLYPNGHGYPCANPRPLNEPVKIGDIGLLTDGRLKVLDNIYSLPEAFTKGNPVPGGKVISEPNVFNEGDTITGGIDNCAVDMSENEQTINKITAHCSQEEGAMLVITSPAELQTVDDSNPLRDYLCHNGARLFEYLQQRYNFDGDSSLYIVTGTTMSATWAIATHSRPMRAPHNTLVLARFTPGVGCPHFVWTRRANAQVQVGGNGIDGKKDQCLFLRGFLLTPSLATRKAKKFKLKVKGPSATPSDLVSPDGQDTIDNRPSSSTASSTHNLAGKRHRNFRFLPTESQSPPESRPIGLSDAGFSIEAIPPHSSSPGESYPLYHINTALTELTEAKFAITHDDDWREILESERDGDHTQEYLIQTFVKCFSQSVRLVNDVAYLEQIALEIHTTAEEAGVQSRHSWDLAHDSDPYRESFDDPFFDETPEVSSESLLDTGRRLRGLRRARVIQHLPPPLRRLLGRHLIPRSFFESLAMGRARGSSFSRELQYTSIGMESEAHISTHKESAKAVEKGWDTASKKDEGTSKEGERHLKDGVKEQDGVEERQEVSDWGQDPDPLEYIY